MLYRMIKGAIFCQVRRRRPLKIGIAWVTSGTQKWKGANPSLIIRATSIR